MLPMLTRPAAVRIIGATAVITGLGGCGTEPSDLEPGVYRLVAADGAISGSIPCFASSLQYSGGALVREQDCDVALRSYEARFDSTGPVPRLVFTARVRLQDGDSAAWQIGIPATVQNNTIQYDFTDFAGGLTNEQLMVTPQTGTLVDGVLTLQMRTYASGGLPDRTDYIRQDPSVFILTTLGRLPARSALASHYIGMSFSGVPAEWCSTDVSFPRCFERSFTLSSSGGSWVAAYEELVTAEGDTLGGMQLTASSLSVINHPNAFIRISSPGPGREGDPLRFDAEGSLVGGTLTLFTTYYDLGGTPLVNPIVARAIR